MLEQFLVWPLPNNPAGHDIAKTQVLDAVFANVPVGHTAKHAPNDKNRLFEQDWHYVGDRHVGQVCGQSLHIRVAESP